jgi:hypothetical protein
VATLGGLVSPGRQPVGYSGHKSAPRQETQLPKRRHHTPRLGRVKLSGITPERFTN